MTNPHNHVAIIGTGFGGIATAVHLQQAGFDDLVLLDRAGEVGGVWRDNDYCAAIYCSTAPCSSWIGMPSSCSGGCRPHTVSGPPTMSSSPPARLRTP